MDNFKNKDGQVIVTAMIVAIQQNKAYLGEIDGLIGDGDHGMNMNKGFTMAQKKIENGGPYSFAQSLEILGETLFDDIGGSMGPIYGTVFSNMAETAEVYESIGLKEFAQMLGAGLEGLCEIVDAKVGDKTLVDSLAPACDSLMVSLKDGESFQQALKKMKDASESGKNATKDMVAKFGRSSRLGERSRGVLDAGATSCNLILQAMADKILEILS